MKNNRSMAVLTPKIKAVLSIALESIVPDLRPLVAALFLSSPDEETRIRKCYPAEHIIFYALNAACDFRKDENLRNSFIAAGFFNEQLEHLLAVAKMNRMAGARLMPIFCAALTDADMLKIPQELQDRILAHIEWQRQKDGFAITEMSRGNNVVVPADDVLR